jgi:hypothetical protein
MKLDDAIKVLTRHFATLESDGGIKSLDLASTGSRGTNSPDAGMIGRVAKSIERDSQVEHRRVTAALRAMNPTHANALQLAYGVTLRSRDIDDGARGKTRKAPRSEDRNWRVKMRELYGETAAIVIALPIANEMFNDYIGGLYGASLAATKDARKDAAEERVNAVAGGIIAYLLGPGKPHAPMFKAKADALKTLALEEFVDTYKPAAKPKRKSGTEARRAKILAYHAQQGQEINA